MLASPVFWRVGLVGEFMIGDFLYLSDGSGNDESVCSSVGWGNFVWHEKFLESV